MLYDDPFDMTPPRELLQRCGEPLLAESSCTAAFRGIRLSQSLASRNDFCVSVYRQGAVAELTTKACPSAVSDRRRWTTVSSRALEIRTFDAFLKAFHSLGFWQIPGVIDEPGSMGHPHFILEVWERPRYHQVSRFNLSKEVQRLFDQILAVGGVGEL